MVARSFLSLIALPMLASAHFQMLYPIPRSTDDETEAQGPCGGFAVSENRTQVSTTSFPIALQMGHDRSVIQMLLALGNDPEDNFNITLKQTFQEQGEGYFCLPDVTIPSELKIADGTNGTIQVITDGENGGGLYICSDVTFSSRAVALSSSCVNGTGVTSSPLSANESTANANETTADGTPTGTASGSSSSPTNNQAAIATTGWGFLGAAIVGAVALM